MLETKSTEFPALSVDPRVRISLSASETDDRLFFLPNIEQKHIISLKLLQFTLFDGQLRRSFWVFRYGALVSFETTDVTFSVSCELSQPMGKTEFSSTAKNRTNSVS